MGALVIRQRAIGDSPTAIIFSLSFQKDYEKWVDKPLVIRQRAIGDSPTHKEERKGPTKKTTLSESDDSDVQGVKSPKPKGPPQPPNENHKDFHRLSYGFYQDRVKLLNDTFFDPWHPKEIKLCKTIVEQKARGDMEEVRRRYLHLVRWSKVKPDFFTLTPGCLSSQWDRLNDAPVGSAPGESIYAELT